MTKPPLPVPVLHQLKCVHCKKFVTCGPVHVVPDSNILCGRCIRLSKNIYRNLVFEALAGMYRYPCHYWPKHCNKQLQWNEALDHEKNCLYQSSCNVFCSKPVTFFKSDRKLPKNPEIPLKEVTDDVLETLKCVVCANYLSNAPVYIVIDGKNICHRCVNNNGVPEQVIRNTSYEILASSVIFPCIYRLRGCETRLPFGRKLWGHESECPYGQIANRLSKKPSKVIGKGGKEKERGVIETHSGHIWGTITPLSAPFAPKSKNNEGKMITRELTEVMKKKNEENKNFDAQSVDSIMSRASTFDSLGDNISRTTADNISRDNISRSTIDNISRGNLSRSSSKIVHQSQRKISNETMLSEQYRPSHSGHIKNQPRSLSYDAPENIRYAKTIEHTNLNYEEYPQEIQPTPAPIGYNRVPYHGFHPEHPAGYSRFSQYDANAFAYQNSPPYYENNGADMYLPTQLSHIRVGRGESFRVGNQELIDELKVKQQKKNSVLVENNPHV